MRRKILFLIDSLGGGGAERALYNLTNNIDYEKYEIHVMTLYDMGIYKDKLNKNVIYSSASLPLVKGINYIFKFLPSTILHRLLIKEKYDLEVAFLEGITTKIVAGANRDIKKAAFVRIDISKYNSAQKCFITFNSMKNAYSKMKEIAFVGQDSLDIFKDYLKIDGKLSVVQNIVEIDTIIEKGNQKVDLQLFNHPLLVSVGRIQYQKGYDLLVRAHHKLILDGYKHTILILGMGPDFEKINDYIKINNLEKSFILKGFDENPFKYVKNADWFICTSRYEGFSSSIREAVILQTPVVTTSVSGVKELFGNNEYGLVIPCNEEEIYKVLKKIITTPKLQAMYKEKINLLSNKFTLDQMLRDNYMFLERLLEE